MHFILSKLLNFTPFCDTKAKHCKATQSPPNDNSADEQTVAEKISQLEQIFKIPLVISKIPIAKNSAGCVEIDCGKRD